MIVRQLYTTLFDIPRSKRSPIYQQLNRMIEARFAFFVAAVVALGQLGLILYGVWSSYPNVDRVTQTLTLGALGSLGLLMFLYIPEVGIGLYLFNGIFKTADVFGDPNSIVPTLFILALTIGILAIKEPLVIKQKVKIDPILALLAAFNLLLLVSAFATGIPGALEKALRLSFFTVMSLVMALLIVRSPKQVLRAFRFMALLSAFTAAMSISAFVLEQASGVRSVTLFSSNDVIFGRTLAMGILMSFVLFLYDHTLSKVWRWFLMITLPLTLVSLILSTSRGATVGLVGAAIFALLIHRKRPPLWIFGIIGVSTLVYFYVTTIWGSSVVDLSNFSILTGQGTLDLSTRLRLVMYENAYRNYLANPLLGIGTQSNANYPHNIFLEVASELGTLGLGIFLALAWLLYTKLRNLLKKPTDSVFYIVVQIVTIGVVYSLIIAQFSGNLQHQRSLWLFVALAWALQPNSTARHK